MPIDCKFFPEQECQVTRISESPTIEECTVCAIFSIGIELRELKREFYNQTHGNGAFAYMASEMRDMKQKMR